MLPILPQDPSLERHHTVVRLDGQDLSVGVRDDPEDDTVTVSFGSVRGTTTVVVRLDDLPLMVGALERAMEVAGRVRGTRKERD